MIGLNTAKALTKGILSMTPITKKIIERGTGGTISARYCYSVWLRHMVMAKKSGLNTYPKIVAELGPGDSLGIGLAALLSGCNKYIALDVVEHANNDKNLEIFNELVSLFKNREPIPNDDEFPRVFPKLDDYRFPVHIFDDEIIKSSLGDTRLLKIKESLASTAKKDDSMIQYYAPWSNMDVIKEGFIDMIYSQAVLEHVDELKNTYNTIRLWLKPDGYMSHTIDFKCHGTANEWNGHWLYSDFMWKIIRGKREYLLNREPYSTHISIMNDLKFKIIRKEKQIIKSNITSHQLAEKFRHLSDQDLVMSGAFVQAVKITD